MKPSALRQRLRVFFVMLAWLAQAWMPVAHATVMGGHTSGSMPWCGDAASAAAAWDVLPAELRAALDEGAPNAEQLANCTLLCALSAGSPAPAELAPTVALRAAGLEPAAVAPRRAPPARSQSPTPPAHAPPARG
ncbi:hypothetical protein [Ramlibacter sp.]|uniref:hypothetical protein n=1 Tax=Ramlibacter sp. TaxID=1917967 RepID=UPI003D0E39C1